MSTITPSAQMIPSSPPATSAVSDLIDASETLYRLSVEEYERIGEFLDDPRVELIDGLEWRVNTVVWAARTFGAALRPGGFA